MKSNLLYIVLLTLNTIFSTINAQEIDKKNLSKPITRNNKESKNLSDSIPPNYSLDSIPAKNKKDLNKPKDIIGSITTHNAEDYVIQDARNKTVTLYNKANVLYNNIELEAGSIKIDYANNLVFAKGIFKKDSLGKKEYTQRPKFKQGNQETEQDSIAFNIKTHKALIYGIKTKEGEMFVFGEKTKRVNDSTIYLRNIRFTTSTKKKPDYYIATNKAKLTPGKKIVVGMSQMVIADVPTPLAFPFGYIPLHKNRASGIVMPSYGDNDQQGFFLQNGGYYLVISDYMDLEVTGDIYSNGSWGLNTKSNYNKRYKFSGDFSFRYQKQINSILGFSNYEKNSLYNINWSHRQDPKLNPNSNLSGSVNIGSSKFYKQSTNEIDINNNQNNVLHSSINYYKKFVSAPFNLNLSVTHNQNSNTETINLELPSMSLSMLPQYPFQGKGGVKRNVFQRIGINYSMRGAYSISTNDEDFMTKKMWNQTKSGIDHSTSASTNFKLLKYLNFRPSVNYNDIWYFKTIKKHYKKGKTINGKVEKGEIINDTIKGLSRFNTYGFNNSLSYTRYGMFNFKSKHLKAIRHTYSPNVTWGYTPNCGEKHTLKVRQSEKPDDFEEYTKFDEGMYGSPSKTESNYLSFGVTNNIEAKVAPDDKDPPLPGEEPEYRKITILNGLSINSGYNFTRDSLNWNPVSISASTTIFKNKLNLNYDSSYSLYKITEKGIKLNQFNDKILRMTSSSITANISISNSDFQKDTTEDNFEEDTNNPIDILNTPIGPTSNDFVNSTLEDDMDFMTEGNTENKLYNSKIPWTLSVDYSVYYSDNGYNTKDEDKIEQTINFGGSIEFSPKWNIGFRSGYDFKLKDISSTNINFSRDLDSFRFTFNWAPIGLYRSFNFFIGIKSSLLSDLKWEKSSYDQMKRYD